jgi:hypothetical protein
MPSNYYEVQDIVSALTFNSSGGGVAYFSPDLSLYYNNSSGSFVNPMIVYPEERTAGLGYYGSPYIPSNTYFYWVYKLFYENETQYAGQLFGLAGIEYFVVLDGTSSASYGGAFMPFSDGKNANLLMSYQKGVKLIFSGSDFNIYKNEYYSGTVMNVSNLTLLTGGFNELSTLPSYGFDLTTAGIVMAEDLNTSNYKFIISHVSSIIISNPNSEYGIVLPLVENPLIVSDYATGVYSDNSWVSTENLPQGFSLGILSVTPLAVTNGPSEMSVPVHISNPGNYSLWIQIGYVEGNPPSTLKLTLGNSSMLINTSDTYHNITDSLVWMTMNFYANHSLLLNISNVRGYESIGEAYILPKGAASLAFNELNQTIKSDNIRTYLLNPQNCSTNLSFSYN